MRTFSELVDIVVHTAKVPHKLPFVVMQVNGVIRDLAANHPSDYDLIEERIIPYGGGHGHGNYQSDHCRSTAVATEWRIPCDFRMMRAVKYNGCEFVKNRKPGLVQKASPHFWYQSGNTIVFSGKPQCIDIAYYAHQPTFLYRDPKKRRIKSNNECDWLVRETCQSDTPDDPALLWVPYCDRIDWHNALHMKEVCWVINRHYDVIANGALSRIFNGEGDVTRGGRYYQAYITGKKEISRTRKANLEAEL